MKDEFIILQLYENCYFYREFGASTFGSVGNPLLATRLGSGCLPKEQKEALFKEVGEIFKSAKLIKVKVQCSLEDL